MIEDKKRIYELDSPEEIVRYQLESFNSQWARIKNEHPFYNEWASKHSLPERIETLEELKKFPVLSKKDIQENADLVLAHLNKYQIVSTGGSTGEPTKFPTAKGEKDFEYSNTYLGRSRLGIEPLARTVLLWGHSHLFGTGLVGKINQLRRRLSDYLINTTRLDAYDLSVDSVGGYAKRIAAVNPELLIGYTSAVFKVAQYVLNNKDVSLEFSHLKCVIVTSETVTINDIKIIREAFRVPVVLEYGMAESSVIAYSSVDPNVIDVFWDSFIAQSNQEKQLLITTLNERLFPLINYDTSDCINVSREFHHSILSFESISGRKKDNVVVACSGQKTTELSGILLVHILKGYPNLYSISYKQLSDNCVEINVISNASVDILEMSRYFLYELKRDYPQVSDESFVFKQVENESLYISGKVRTNLG
jgi:phenylacetate-coenzyme A ligase PaaK-like adenylate-forming protein